MPLQVDPPPGKAPSRETACLRGCTEGIVVGLVNNMPDAALDATESQFSTLLEAACESLPVRLRYSTLPEVPRNGQAQARIESAYWPIEELFDEGLDALIVTGTEPKAPQLPQEPYWPRLTRVLDWANENTITSIWSCLAAHAAVLHVDGIERRRLPEKCCGVFDYQVAPGHALSAGLGSSIRTPHSRWNDLLIQELAQAGYRLLSYSEQRGADIFVKQGPSLLVFLQGHPEYEDCTLLKEYRRDVGRYLSGQQENYPTLPCAYCPPTAVTALAAFREQALSFRDERLLAGFPGASLAALLVNCWRPTAIQLYKNWFSFIASHKDSRRPARESVSLPAAWGSGT
ncbi:MAG TPA: homoserine O-succinyltransferase [Burkholderiaceae bacterium]|nr:homoserine O-succinyltransferase [Burkholderiaceae bacterium]